MKTSETGAVAAYREFRLDLCVVLILLFLWGVGVDFMKIGLDTTDTSDGARSGMDLRTDHGTGCQYLESTGGGLTPRLGRDGKQVCEVTP